MLLGINQITAYGNNIFRYNNKQQPSFGRYSYVSLRHTGYLYAAFAMLAMTSCTNKDKLPKEDTVEISKNTKKADSSSVKANQDDSKNQVIKSYHYFPTKDNVIKADQYDWVETIYPDGRIERDSLGYKISIASDGKRTEEHTEKNDSGQVLVTTKYPDGSKMVRQYDEEIQANGLNYTETIYRADNTKKEVKYYNEIPSDSADYNSEKKTKISHYFYNEKDVLFKWESEDSDSTVDSLHSKYDNYNRLVYDSVKNEKYFYKGQKTIPYRSEIEIEGCKRITLYDEKGNIERIYFKASDGTITKDK